MSLLSLGRVARSFGFSTRGLRVDYSWISAPERLPCIAHWKGNHYVVVCRADKDHVTLMDPARGKVSMRREEFEDGWNTASDHPQGHEAESRGVVLELLPPPEGLTLPEAISANIHQESFDIRKALSKYRKAIIRICTVLLVLGMADIAAPMLTRALFDLGIGRKSLYGILLALGGMMCVTIGRTVFSALQSLLVLKSSNGLCVDLTMRLLEKFARLPRTFFDFKSTGETLQTMFDVSRIDSFLTNALPQVLTASASVIISCVMLAWLDFRIVVIYIPFLLVHALWMGRYMKRRRNVDMNIYEMEASNNDCIIEYVRGILELRLTDSDRTRRCSWQSLRDKYYGEVRRSMLIDQKQSAGIAVIGRLADLSVVFVTAIAVVAGEMTIGTMMAIQYLSGSLSAPAQQLVMFMRQIQDYRISAARITGVYSLADERNIDSGLEPVWKESIVLEDVCMAYNPEDGNVIENISFSIPKGSTVALVGESGSGKSTLLKLLLGIYRPAHGRILIDGVDINDVNIGKWRSLCMTAFCDNYIFDDTLANNIAMGNPDQDMDRIMDACRMACLEDVIDSMPQGVHTQLGPHGMRLSNGQRQRVILARAFYFHPSILVLDEATNALDTQTERTVYSNVYSRFKDATVIVAAHRLSTIAHADNILVLKDGRIIESGTHSELCRLNGFYARSFRAQSVDS